MNTKKCKKCGWVFPITHPKRHCKFCGEPFDEGFCRHCGKYTKLHPYNFLCKDCFTMVNTWHTTDALERKRAKQDKELLDWVDAIQSVPIRILSEQEWLRACSYFGKCAYCKNEDIAARTFFVSYALGGRYTAWNILPVCEHCALKYRSTGNPFVQLDRPVLDKIISYLQDRLLEEIT